MEGPPSCTPRPKGTPRKKKARRARPSTDKNAATVLHSLIVRSVGRCEAAPFLPDILCEGRLEAAHFIRRARSGVRTDLTNAAALCQAHHRWVDSHLADLIALVDYLHGPGHYRALQAKADAWKDSGVTPAAFWRADRARLRDIAIKRGLRIR